MRFALTATAAAMTIAAPTRAQHSPARDGEPPRLPAPDLAFHYLPAAQAAPQPQRTPDPDTSDAAQALEAPSDRIPFGRAGAQFLTFGAGVGSNFNSDTDYNVHIAWSTFLADELELALEGGGWYHDQRGQNTGSLNGNVVFRWHFLHPDTPPEIEWDWTVYMDVGIGAQASFDNVPDEGTGFTFTPRAGGGWTKRLSDNGTRLQLGLRWHHISNGRIEGDARNPSRDDIMVYAGIIIPF